MDTHTHTHTHRLHEFVWHGSDSRNPGRFSPAHDKFSKLCHVPHQLYYNVKDVRTNDDTLITVKLMLFYELEDIDTMVSKRVTAVRGRVAASRSLTDALLSLSSTTPTTQLQTSSMQWALTSSPLPHSGGEDGDTACLGCMTFIWGVERLVVGG